MTQQRKEKITDAILMLILLVYPLRKANIGLDLMDAGYTLGNYKFFDTMNQNWKIATYLANVLGVMLSSLPYGDTWVGMNVYTGLLIGMTAAVSYYFLIKIKMGHRFVIFLGELVALSLCWSPSVNLYHYLGFTMMTIATMLLYKAVTEEKKSLFAIAGFILGSAVAVRMPNITYMALIVPVWYYAWLNRKEDNAEGKNNKWFGKLVGQTGYSIMAYCIGLIIPIGYICIRYGMDAYPNMISFLFGMTDTATDYKPTSMVTAMFEEYIQYGVWLVLLAVYLGGGLILIKICKGRFEKTKRMLFIAGMAVVLRLCYGRGMFDFNYTAYFSMYKWLVVFLLIAILLCIWLLVSRRVQKEHKLWAVFLLVLIFVTPLGGNNGVYPTINNMYLIAPITLALLWRYVSESCQQVKDNAVMVSFVCKSMLVFVCTCVTIQSILFGIGFVFHDAKSTEQSYETVDMDSFKSTKGLKTTVEKRDEIMQLGGYLTKNHLLDKEVILYGDIPAVSYIYDLQPAIYTTWADLASNPLAQLEGELASEEMKQKKPLVILSALAAQKLENKSERQMDKKLEAIYRFMADISYEKTYSSNLFCVYEVR